MPTSAPLADAPRARVGRYEVLRRIAVGGMAELFLARSASIEGFEKLVALKRMLPTLANDAEFVQMFLEEARIAATLQHSNIVQVYDVGRVDGDYFFAMEFLHGSDLSGVMRALAGGMIPLAHVIHTCAAVCAGLHHAHEQTLAGRPLGIVHRDVSPQNIFVTFDGGVKLVDFGIAKAALRQAKTRTGTLKGKIRYMSPEQCQSLPLDRRSDVFSLCIVLWELTTGRRLYSGRGDLDVLRAIVDRDATRPSLVAPAYPPELERIVMRGLARDPAERYATAQELQTDLEAYAHRAGLMLSAGSLRGFMRDLFVERIAAWEEALREGRDADLVSWGAAHDDEDDEDAPRTDPVSSGASAHDHDDEHSRTDPVAEVSVTPSEPVAPPARASADRRVPLPIVVLAILTIVAGGAAATVRVRRARMTSHAAVPAASPVRVPSPPAAPPTPTPTPSELPVVPEPLVRAEPSPAPKASLAPPRRRKAAAPRSHRPAVDPDAPMTE